VFGANLKIGGGSDKANSGRDKKQDAATVNPREIDPQGWDRLVIPQDNKYKAVFDVFVAACVLFSSISVPFELAYSYEFPAYVDVLLDTVFIADVVLQCFHGYEELGFPVTSLAKVSARYIRTWFALDLFAAIPFERILTGHTWTKPLKLIKTIRLLRVKRLLRRFQGQAGGNAVRVIVILGFWLLVTHWFASFFLYIGWQECGYGADSESWVLAYDRWASIPQFVIDCRNGAPPIDSVQPDPIGIYVRSFAWALATMSSLGYGNAPVAVTSIEHLFAICAQVTGACLAAAIFGNIAQMINKGDAVATRYQALFDKINEFNRFHKLPRHLREKLHAYNDLLFAINRGFDLHAIASIFPVNLQEDIFFLLHEHLLRKVPIFDGCHDEFVRALARQLRAEVLIAGDYAFKMNEMGKSMYFLQTGFMQVGNGDFTVVYATLKAGAYFGELAMFTSQRRTASARALRNCVLYTLSVTHFEETIQTHPKYYETILNKAMEQLENTMQTNTSIEARMQKMGAKRALSAAKIVPPGCRESCPESLGGARKSLRESVAQQCAKRKSVNLRESGSSNAADDASRESAKRGSTKGAHVSDWRLLRALVMPHTYTRGGARTRESEIADTHEQEDGESFSTGAYDVSTPAADENGSADGTRSRVASQEGGSKAAQAGDAPDGGSSTTSDGGGEPAASEKPDGASRRSDGDKEKAGAFGAAEGEQPPSLRNGESSVDLRESERPSKRITRFAYGVIAGSNRQSEGPGANKVKGKWGRCRERLSVAGSEGGDEPVSRPELVQGVAGSVDRKMSYSLDFGLQSREPPPGEDDYDDLKGVSFQTLARVRYKEWHTKVLRSKSMSGAPGCELTPTDAASDGSFTGSSDSLLGSSTRALMLSGAGPSGRMRGAASAADQALLRGIGNTLIQLSASVAELNANMRRMADRVDPELAATMKEPDPASCPAATMLAATSCAANLNTIREGSLRSETAEESAARESMVRAAAPATEAPPSLDMASKGDN